MQCVMQKKKIFVVFRFVSLACEYHCISQIPLAIHESLPLISYFLMLERDAKDLSITLCWMATNYVESHRGSLSTSSRCSLCHSQHCSTSKHTRRRTRSCRWIKWTKKTKKYEWFTQIHYAQSAAATKSLQQRWEQAQQQCRKAPRDEASWVDELDCKTSNTLKIHQYLGCRCTPELRAAISST